MKSFPINYICCCCLILLPFQVAHADTQSTLTVEETKLFTNRLVELVSLLKSGELHRILFMPKVYPADPSVPILEGKMQVSGDFVGVITAAETGEFLELISRPEMIANHDSSTQILCIPLMKKSGTTPELIMEMQFFGRKLVIRIKVPSTEPFPVQADFVYSEKVGDWVRSKMIRLENRDKK